jgi:Rod binding domain-containing protein
MPITPIVSSASAPGVELTRSTSPEKIKKAAEDFEALLIGQMLKSVRESSTSGWANADQAGGAALDLAEQKIAQMIASNGGLGLARLISSGLDRSTQERIPAAPNGSRS